MKLGAISNRKRGRERRKETEEEEGE